MDNKFDLKKFLAENRNSSVNEGTELVKGDNFTFNRFSTGDGKMGLQISNNSKIGEYIHVPGALLGEFGVDFEKAREVFDDTKRQQPIDEDHGGMYIDDEEWDEEMGRTPEDTEKEIDREQSKLNEDIDYTDMATPDDGLLYVDKRDDETGRRTESGQIIHINGIRYRVFDSNDLMDLAQSQRLEGDLGNHLLIKVEEE